MNDKKYRRLVQTAVTVFINKDGKYLLLKRNQNKRVDPGKLNGVGGRLEQGEDFLACCIREIEEETGYQVSNNDIRLVGVVKLEGGYPEDWIVCFFKVQVQSFTILKGSKTEDGELVWLDQDKVLNSKYELVDDLKYCFSEIIAGKSIFFTSAILNSEEKIEKYSASNLLQ